MQILPITKADAYRPGKLPQAYTCWADDSASDKTTKWSPLHTVLLVSVDVGYVLTLYL